MANTTAGFTPVAETDVFDPASDINRAELFVEKLLTDTAPTPADLTTLFPSPYPGEQRYVVSVKSYYVYNGSAWVPVTSAVVSSITFAGIYSSSGATAASVVLEGGRVYLEGSVISTSATFVAGTTYTLGTIPSSLAPAAAQAFACTSNSTAVAHVAVDSAGNLTFILNTGFTGALSLALGGCSWRSQ